MKRPIFDEDRPWEKDAHIEDLNDYIDFLEKELSKLQQPTVISSVCNCEPHTFYEWEKDENKCSQCGKQIYKQTDL